VWKLPEIKPHVTEYPRHRLRCPQCGQTTCADLPAAVPRGQSGPRLIAFTALLMAYLSSKQAANGVVLGRPLESAVLPVADREAEKGQKRGPP